MPKKSYRAVCQWDDEAKVWYVEKCDIPGLCTDAETLDQLADKVVRMAQDLLDADHRDYQEVPIELLTYHRMGARC